MVPLLLLVLVLSHAAKAELDRDSLRLVWHDEFLGEGLDGDKWVVDEGDGCDVDLCDWGNGEKQYYRSENADVGDGVLSITAMKYNYSSRFYTSSKVTTKNRFAFRYGRAEARIKLPEGGQGLWPAFWMMPQDNVYGEWAASGEIDILESRNNLTEVSNNLNFGDAYPNNTNYNEECVVDFPEGALQEYHTYAIEWDADEMFWFMDGEETCHHEYWYGTYVKNGTRAPKPAPFDQDFYIVLNVAVGGNSDYVGDGPVDDSALPAQMMVDWVRVYQTPEQFGEGPTSPYVRNATGGGSKQGVMVWGDDVNGTEVSLDWDVAEGDECLIGAQRLCSSEIQVFHSDEVVAEGGILSLYARASTTSSGGTDLGVVQEADAGLIRTLGSFNFTYGRVEATLSMPSVPGVVSTVSLIPVTAEQSGDDAGQVDVVAAEGGQVTGGLWYLVGDAEEATAANITCVAPSPMDGSEGEPYSSSSFYTLAVEWTEERMRWYSGGIQYCEASKSEVIEAGNSWPFDQDMYVAVGVAVGRDAFGESVSVNSSLLPSALEVDSVRIYRFADMDGTPIQASATWYVQEGNLTWQDEFDGVELDEASAAEAGEGYMGLEYWWQHEEGNGCEMGICGFGNGEAQWYTSDNAAIKDGKLIITAKAQPYGDNIYTSAKLSTNTTVLIKYGRIEVRVKLPRAQGLWPSIWLLPHNSPYGGWASSGAIDLLQSRNYMDRVHGQLVFGGAYPDVDDLDLYQGGHCYADFYEDFSDDYHVFALEWEEDAFRWYVDDILYCDRNYWYSRPGPGEDDYPFPAPFDTEFYLIFNVAVGGSFTGGLIDEAALDDDPQMFVDYVRVYQFEGQSIKIAERPESSGGSLSAVTALAVLSVLGLILSLCLVIGCIAKLKSKRAERALMNQHLSDFHSGVTDTTKGLTPPKGIGGVTGLMKGNKYHLGGPSATTNGIVAASSSAAADRVLKGKVDTGRRDYDLEGLPPTYPPVKGQVSRGLARSIREDAVSSDYGGPYPNDRVGDYIARDPLPEPAMKQPRPPSGVIPPGWIGDDGGGGDDDDDDDDDLSGAGAGVARGRRSSTNLSSFSPLSSSHRSMSSRATSSAWGSGPFAARVAHYDSSSSGGGAGGGPREVAPVPGNNVGLVFSPCIMPGNRDPEEAPDAVPERRASRERASYYGGAELEVSGRDRTSGWGLEEEASVDASRPPSDDDIDNEFFDEVYDEEEGVPPRPPHRSVEIDGGGARGSYGDEADGGPLPTYEEAMSYEGGRY